MERNAIEKIASLLKERIRLHEQEMNPYYHIGDIALKGAYEFDIKEGGKKSISYEVEYVSRLDNRWRKWYSKEIKLRLSEIVSDWRDRRISEVLKESDTES